MNSQMLRREAPQSEDELDARVALMLYLQRRRATLRFRDAGLSVQEPAWDILLDLYVAHCGGRTVTVGDACVAADAPTSTALRTIYILHSRGLVTLTPDKDDRRRRFIALADAGVTLLKEMIALERMFVSEAVFDLRGAPPIRRAGNGAVLHDVAPVRMDAR